VTRTKEAILAAVARRPARCRRTLTSSSSAGAGSKEAKARELGLVILDEAGFVAAVGDCRSSARRTWTSSRWAPPPRTRAYGPTRNPWDLERIPGGSGGGSARRWPSFEAPLAIGTDTGGSIRQPARSPARSASKPTYGGVSRYGLVAMASSLDQAGPCARTVLDAALLHEVIGGHDPRDSTSIDAPVPAGRRGGARRRRARACASASSRADRRGLPAPGCSSASRGARTCWRRRRRDRRGLLPALQYALAPTT
jgi:hypothetical protein